MDIQRLVRNPDKVKACLKELEDGSLVAVKPVKIYIPVRFNERNLASIGIETYIVGVCATVTEDGFYATSLINAMWKIEPTSTEKVMINEDEYYQFTFEPGARVIVDTKLVKTDTLVYRIYDEIISKARVPWYVSYIDLGHLFDTAGIHAGASVGNNKEIVELIISIIARNPMNRHIQYRTTITSLKDVTDHPPAYIPMRSVVYAASNTLNKLAGNRFQDGLTSALVTPTERVEKLEELLTR